MAIAARKIEMEPTMHEQSALEVKVDHLQKEVSGLTTNVQRLDTRVNAVHDSLVEHRIETERSFGKVRAEIAALRNEMTASIGALRDETKESIAALRNDMTAAIGALRVEMKDSIEKFRNNRTAQIGWMISTVIAAIGAAFTVAKFFAAP